MHGHDVQEQKFVLPVHEDTKTKLKNKIFSEVLKWRNLAELPAHLQGDI
jgi:hypothetical protein